MPPQHNHQVRLKSCPTGIPQADHFEIVEAEVPQKPAEGFRRDQETRSKYVAKRLDAAIGPRRNQIELASPADRAMTQFTFTR